MDKLKGLDLEEKLVLDAGTGGCNMTRYLSEWGAEVISVDYRPDWQKQCRDIIDKTQFITADLGNMPFFKSEIFDYVICNFVVSALSESKSLLISSPLREFYRILKKNGMLVVIDYQPFIKDVSSCKLDDVQIELWK
ncbi:MAG: class I SAM-dependent methyltransferase, partial [Thermoplasmatota archaeon]